MYIPVLCIQFNHTNTHIGNGSYEHATLVFVVFVVVVFAVVVIVVVVIVIVLLLFFVWFSPCPCLLYTRMFRNSKQNLIIIRKNHRLSVAYVIAGRVHSLTQALQNKKVMDSKWVSG